MERRDPTEGRGLIGRIGLHPLVALAAILVDAMLFAPDVTGVGWLVSVLVGVLLMIPAVLLQRHAYGDGWAMAVSKGMLVGLVTAIPTPLPAVVTGAGGLLGLAGANRRLPDGAGDGAVARPAEKGVTVEKVETIRE